MRTAHIITVGKHDNHIKALLETYLKRLSSNWRVQWHVCKTADRSTENNYFREQLRGTPYIALDESGASVSSQGIADYLERSASSGQNELYFLIGGSYGIEDDLLSNATKVWSFGAITLPHQLARLLVVEQLYRAQSILSGSSYHH